MRKLGWAAAAMAAVTMVGCGTGGGMDAGDVRGTDVPQADVPRTDTPAAEGGGDTMMAGNSSAGTACTDDTPCAASMLTCDTMVTRGGACTGPCTQGTATEERMQCGGRNSTCIVGRSGSQGMGECRATCTTGGPMSTCRSGFACASFTGLTGVAMDHPPGCTPFCTTDAMCTMGSVCNSRRGGVCGTTGVDMTLLPDGAACNQMAMTPQCRGICLRFQGFPTGQGVCASWVNLRTVDTMAPCPDVSDPARGLVLAVGGMGEDLALCTGESCDCTAQCSAGLVCHRQTNGTQVCTYPTITGLMRVDTCPASDGGTDAPRDVPPG